MPQLNPTPWLLIMLMTWLTINTMSTTINSNTLMKNPCTLMKKNNNYTKKTTTWAWPW